MKIQTVRFKNLNSLSGEWLIDFTDPHYTSSGIFAIVGATGAGKTTILDAISLALYGRTPRLKQISKSTNELMSRQTGNCFAEVEFTSIRGNYRVHWSQHRARKNSSGELQPQKHEFSDVKTGKIIASKLKDVTDEVMDATGMNFEQFTRSMLLAQGEFSKFLQASSDQRAPILEQITGTEIYSRISKQVHQCKTDEETKLLTLSKELEKFQLPDKEELLQIEAEQKKLTHNSSQLQKSIAVTNLGLNWHENLVRLHKKKNELERSNAKLQEQWDSSIAGRKQLEAANESQLLQAPYNHLSHLRQNQKDERKQLENNTVAVTKADQSLVALQQQTKAAQEQFSKKTKEQQATAATIIVVRQLDFENEKRSQEIQTINRNIKSLVIGIDKTKKELQTVERNTSTCLEVTEKIKLYQSNNAQDESLIETFSGIEEKATHLAQLFDTREKQRSLLQTTQESFKQQKASLATKEAAITTIVDQEKQLSKEIVTREEQIEKLAPEGIPAQYNELQLLQTNLQHLRELQKHSEEQKKLIIKQETEQASQNTLTQQLEGVKKELAELSRLVELQATIVKTQEDLVRLAHKMESFEKERGKLQDNTPCPLCGSTNHPYTSSTNPGQDSAQQKLDIETLKLTNLSSKKQTTEIEQNRVQYELDSSRTRSKETSQSLDNIKETIHEKMSLADLTMDIDSEINARQERVLAYQKAIKILEVHSQDLTQQRQRHQKLSHELQSHRENLQQLQQQKGKFENEVEVLSTAVETTEQELARLKTALSELILPYTNTSVFDQKSLPSILQELRQKQLLWKKSITAKQEQEQLLHQYNSAKEKALQSIELHSKETDKLTKQLGILSTEHQTSVTKRTTLFGNKDPLQVERQMQSLVTNAEESLRKIQEELQRADKQRSILHERTQHLYHSITKREESLGVEEGKFSAMLTGSNFASEKHFLQARMEDKDRNQLKVQLDAIETILKETTARRNNIEETIVEEQAKKITPYDYDILKKQLVEQTTEQSNLQQQLGAITEQLRNYEKNIKNLKDKQERYEQQKAELNHWTQLHSLIGSADGKKFRNFAQGLTFELMVSHANQTLEKMSDRYLLRRSPEAPLELTVIDAYQAGEVRSTSNLSGGETFIISLALALGLSAMASQKVQIDSLFLDEGFGTLDEDSLEIALETLSTLQQRGKIIGIISHVPLLKERIDVQLRLHPGLDGRSKISGPGVTQPHLA